MSSGERSRVDAERSFPRVGEEDPGASDIMWNVVFRRLTTSESLTRGLRFRFLLGEPPGISDFFLPLTASLLPWLYTSPVSWVFACSISVSDLRGTHLHRRNVYHLW